MKAISSGIGKRVTMISGDEGSGKNFWVIQIMKLLMTSPDSGRILVVTKSDNQLDFLVSTNLDSEIIII